MLLEKKLEITVFSSVELEGIAVKQGSIEPCPEDFQEMGLDLALVCGSADEASLEKVKAYLSFAKEAKEDFGFFVISLIEASGMKEEKITAKLEEIRKLSDAVGFVGEGGLKAYINTLSEMLKEPGFIDVNFNDFKFLVEEKDFYAATVKIAEEEKENIVKLFAEQIEREVPVLGEKKRGALLHFSGAFSRTEVEEIEKCLREKMKVGGDVLISYNNGETKDKELSISLTLFTE